MFLVLPYLFTSVLSRQNVFPHIPSSALPPPYSPQPPPYQEHPREDDPTVFPPNSVSISRPSSPTEGEGFYISLFNCLCIV